MDQDQQRDHLEEAYNEALLHDEADPAPVCPGPIPNGSITLDVRRVDVRAYAVGEPHGATLGAAALRIGGGNLDLTIYGEWDALERLAGAIETAVRGGHHLADEADPVADAEDRGSQADPDRYDDDSTPPWGPIGVEARPTIEELASVERFPEATR